MKKLSLGLLALSATALAACGTGTSEPVNNDPETLIVQLVPSVSIDSALLTKVKGLEEILEDELSKKGYDINVNISIGTSYASVIEAMASGQVHVGFLTSQQYAFATLEYPEKFDVQLTSVRSAYNFQIDSEGKEITNVETLMTNVNTTENYSAALHPSAKVSSYYSALYVRTEDYEAFKQQGMDWLIGKSVATGSETSASGYLYPLYTMKENNLNFVRENPNTANREVVRKELGNHQASLLGLLSKDVDATFAFLDARSHATAFNAWKEANPGKTQFSETKVVSLTSPIYNDTITAISKLSPGLKAAIQDAFIEAIKLPDGLAALAIYNHTGYLKAIDSDYESERDFFLFLESLK
jgi:phosphonate transport system substrate-binding protein